MASIYDYQTGPDGQLIYTGTPDDTPPPSPLYPGPWNAPDRIASGVNSPSPSLLSGHCSLYGVKRWRSRIINAEFQRRGRFVEAEYDQIILPLG